MGWVLWGIVFFGVVPVLTGHVDINMMGDVSTAAALKDPVLGYETTLLVRDCCLCLHVQRTARALARRFDDVLRPLGLTNGQFSLLMSLNRPAPVGMAGVASLLTMDRTTLTAALKPLVRRGLVKVMADPADRRGRLLRLTAKGSKLLACAVPVWDRAHAEVEGLLSEGEAQRLRSNLGALVWSIVDGLDLTNIYERRMTAMSALESYPRITPFLWFDTNAEEAVEFYLSVFKNSCKLSELRTSEDGGFRREACW
jgi:DNA-binding MarR family transcriptional regulator